MDWGNAEAQLDEACASVFDVTICWLQPKKSGQSVNHGALNDVTRPLFEFMGTIDLEPPADRITRHLPADPGVVNGTVSYDAVLTAHVGDWPYMPRRGDAVLTVGKTYSIVAMRLDGSIRQAFFLKKG
ncbi:hypothetical protein IFT84_13640 [Rhizobium sp. CFBP 8762]|uniref:hypothetical protein n=1 Tax=Rhizobium sp. CFBP 8762 TaxID=2775279 RepID=UPI0017834F04|nr:hypothetical protein [Rhizobium sp. CFBP 8762]MBD8555550.1 hypothetical protein [Rhizobium sp. CFBP 8762]